MQCYRCSKKRRIHGTPMCDKHTRFAEMRRAAKHAHKTVPTWRALEHLHREHCRCCGAQMNYFRATHDTKGNTASLQHWGNGTHEIICTTCNIHDAAQQRRKHHHA